ncbi:TPA: helix-turn-helix domain-containing protein [bacterium]|nr:helix-turn-helix domain-containing protein [bacterium]
MASLGEQLRNTRESKNISLEDASKDVKISMRYLKALEEGDYSEFPAQTYIKGFLTNYAKYLGLDPKSMLAQYSKLMLPKDDEIENFTPKRAQRRLARKRVVMLVIVLILALCSLVAVMWWYSQQL